MSTSRHIRAPNRATSIKVIDGWIIQRESKKSPCTAVFWHFITNGWEFLINFFTHRNVTIYAISQIFIQLTPILMKLCHIKRD